MPSSPPLPRVSIILYAHEEERFIRAAVQSLFDQNYAPLEIFLSDDGSRDMTFEIMAEMAASYTGPHEVILNRNPSNLGIGAQINTGVRKTSGDLVMLANGDDVYPPERVARLVETWLARDRPSAIWTAAEQIDAEGRLRGVRMDMDATFADLPSGVRARFKGGGGATCTIYRREVFEAFGPLPANMLLEDNPLFCRAFLLGRTVHLDEVLVFYRVHQDNISQVYAATEDDLWRSRRRARALWHAREGCRAFVEMLRDLHQAPALAWPRADLERARWAAIEKIFEAAALADYYMDEPTLSEGERWRILLRLAGNQARLTLKRLLPWIERRNEAWELRQYRKNA